jgi:hypothetical protein
LPPWAVVRETAVGFHDARCGCGCGPTHGLHEKPLHVGQTIFDEFRIPHLETVLPIARLIFFDEALELERHALMRARRQRGRFDAYGLCVGFHQGARGLLRVPAPVRFRGPPHFAELSATCEFEQFAKRARILKNRREFREHLRELRAELIVLLVARLFKPGQRPVPTLDVLIATFELRIPLVGFLETMGRDPTTAIFRVRKL